MSSLFKIKIKPIEKDRDWEVRQIGAGRKKKVCATCSKPIAIGSPSVTFTKRKSVGAKTEYDTKHTCDQFCAAKLAADLNIDLSASYVN